MNYEDNFRGWDIDLNQWDELDRFDLTKAIAFFSRGIEEVGRQMLEAVNTIDIRCNPRDDLPKLSGYLEPKPGYEAPPPNRRRFKRNARKSRK